jgi:hypothetical protein
MTTRTSDEAIRTAGRQLARTQQPMSPPNAQHCVGPLTAAVAHLNEQDSSSEKEPDAA